MSPREPDGDPVEWVRERWAGQGLPEPERFAAMASLLRTHQVVTAELDRALSARGLSRTAYMLLVTLALSPDGARRLSYLARYLMVHQTTVTQMVDTLQERGLLARRAHPTDRRTTLAVLSDAGRALVHAGTEDAAAVGFGLGAVDEGTLAALSGALQSIRRARGDIDA